MKVIFESIGDWDYIECALTDEEIKHLYKEGLIYEIEEKQRLLNIFIRSQIIGEQYMPLIGGKKAKSKNQ